MYVRTDPPVSRCADAATSPDALQHLTHHRADRTCVGVDAMGCQGMACVYPANTGGRIGQVDV